jgi:uncharacterized protein YkwD
LSPLPDSAFCSAVAVAEPAQRAREDELLQALNDVRAQGGVTCDADPPSAMLPELRLDARLTCAARVFASDVNTTRSRSLTDSQGRSTPQRLSAAGYDDNGWAESFAFESGSAGEALNIMLADSVSCPRLVGSSYLDVGVGYVGDANVLTLAAP